jgi:hypothetical protein
VHKKYCKYDIAFYAGYEGLISTLNPSKEGEIVAAIQKGCAYEDKLIPNIRIIEMKTTRKKCH